MCLSKKLINFSRRSFSSYDIYYGSIRFLLIVRKKNKYQSIMFSRVNISPQTKSVSKLGQKVFKTTKYVLGCAAVVF